MRGPFRRQGRLVYGGDRSANHCSEIAPLMDSLIEDIIMLSLRHSTLSEGNFNL